MSEGAQAFWFAMTYLVIAGVGAAFTFCAMIVGFFMHGLPL